MHADDPSVADRVVVVVDARATLREVAHVHHRAAYAVGQRQALDEGRERHGFLVHLDEAVRAVERVAGGILAALGEAREQESRGRGCVDLDAWRDAQAGNAAHR